MLSLFSQRVPVCCHSQHTPFPNGFRRLIISTLDASHASNAVHRDDAICAHCTQSRTRGNARGKPLETHHVGYDVWNTTPYHSRLRTENEFNLYFSSSSPPHINTYFSSSCIPHVPFTSSGPSHEYRPEKKREVRRMETSGNTRQNTRRMCSGERRERTHEKIERHCRR